VVHRSNLLAGAALTATVVGADAEAKKVMPTAGLSAKDIVAVVHSLALSDLLDDCVLDAALRAVARRVGGSDGPRNLTSCAFLHKPLDQPSWDNPRPQVVMACSLACVVWKPPGW